MPDVAGDQVLAALTEMLSALEPATGVDWTTRAGPIEWTCWETAVHVGHDLLAYAAQVAARRTDSYLPLDLQVRRDTSPVEVLNVVRACGTLLVGALRLAGPDARAWHFGTTDPTGFEAMAVGEILVHTHDIAAGLRLLWRPPPQLSQSVVTRLLPHAPPGDPTEVLLWSTGRGSLKGQRAVSSWVWQAATH